MARNLLSKKRGETLIELVIAISIFALILTWEVSAFSYFSQTGGDLGSLSEVVSLADSKIELLKADTLTQLNADLPASGTTGTVQEFSPSNNYQYRYTRATDLTNGNFKLIEISLNVIDKKTSGIVYTIKTSFLRQGELNVGN